MVRACKGKRDTECLHSRGQLYHNAVLLLLTKATSSRSSQGEKWYRTPGCGTLSLVRYGSSLLLVKGGTEMEMLPCNHRPSIHRPLPPPTSSTVSVNATTDLPLESRHRRTFSTILGRGLALDKTSNDRIICAVTSHSLIVVLGRVNKGSRSAVQLGLGLVELRHHILADAMRK